MKEIYDYAKKYNYAKLEANSMPLDDTISIFNKYSPIKIEIGSNYTCNDLNQLIDYINEDRGVTIYFSDLLLNITKLDRDIENISKNQIKGIIINLGKKYKKIFAYKDLIEDKIKSIDPGTALFNKIQDKYISEEVLLKGASKLGFKIENNRIYYNNHEEQILLLDYCLNKLYYKLSKKTLKKYSLDEKKYYDFSSNILERYKITMNCTKEEEQFIQEFLDSKYSVYEVIDVVPPLIWVKNIFDKSKRRSCY